MSAPIPPSNAALKPSLFARLAASCHDRRRRVLIGWIAAIVVLFGVSGATGNSFRDQFDLPDSDSKAGVDILDRDFGGQGTGATGTIVFRAEQGVDDPAVQAAMSELFDKVAAADNVLGVESPYAPGGERLISSNGPEAGRIAYANVNMPDDIQLTDATKIRDLILDDEPDIDGLAIELGGVYFAEFENPSSEAIGLAFAIVILILAFGSVLAMGLPIGVALGGIFSGVALVIIASNVATVPETGQFVGIMIGLGVGIDYALLIVTRFREQMHLGHTVRESVIIAIDTAGRSVLFAGGTVVISLLGMLVMGVAFVTGIALSAALVVLVTIVASLTLLPALLGFAGTNVERTRWRGLIAAGFFAVALFFFGIKVPAIGGIAVLLGLIVIVLGFFVSSLKAEVKRRPMKPLRETLAYRWSRVIQHRPWPAAIGSAIVLLILAIPLLGLRLGFADESNYQDDTTTKKAYNLLVEGFGVGFNGPMLLVADLPAGYDQTQLDAIGAAVNPDAEGPSDGVAFLSPPTVAESGTSVQWVLIPTTGPQDEKTTDLVGRLRDNVLPPVESAAGLDINVTGTVAINVDFSNYLADRLPYFFLAVLALSFLLLMAVFRSLLVPLKAVIMNLLTIGAAYGVVVAMFQWGWLGDLTNVSPAPIETWIPMMLFAITFGLSMDYEVFLLSRVQEEWRRTGDTRTSVADGLAATAKVITAAAAIMVVVFGSFLLENDRALKIMGVGLAVAILLDATIVRMVLVPSTMELLGDKNWWLPRWLDKILPKLNVEGHVDHPGDDDGAGEDGQRVPAFTTGE
jgi:RND superfamily putative drug exporter